MSEQIKVAPTLEMLRARRDEILAIAEQYGVSNIRVFGSVARGEATSESDIDLLITTPLRFSIFDLIGVWLDLKDLLGYEVSLVTDENDDELDSRGKRFRRRIQADITPL